ncbi:hypothetical protein NE398_18285 [Clostridium tertium]|uniref:Uncharacterized protein n=1 Tax=Clostridium tertium TaxID=1559 RepID=A0A9X3XS29_9CLOT|nr:hypothetical protein [Clostridium tertium]MDC4242087.1 hypothetical protein [Clostridium tertium]
MKTSGIITFILLLLLGILTLVGAMGMESVLKSAMYFIVIAAITILVSIITFISSLKNNKKIFLISSIAAIILGPVGFFISRILISKDYLLHKELINSNNFALGVFAVTMLLCFIMGIVNTSLSLIKKK